ncbi:hypothetical protein ScPMuIL_008321, partial [Solemya velum]
GYYNCLGRDGTIYSRLKHVWLQGRQVWMLARLYHETDRFQKPEILEAAVKGAEFLMKYAKNRETMKCYLVLTEDGKPVDVQRTIFSECFNVMGFSELSRATGRKKYMEEALKMMGKIVHWVYEDDTDLGKPKLVGKQHTSTMAVPMMLLCLIEQLETVDDSLAKDYEHLTKTCIKEILTHIQRNGTVVLENVSPSGEELPGYDGRLMVPGHSIEAGWFLLRRIRKSGKSDMTNTIIESFITKPFNVGWDSQHGGLFYFLDVDQHSPVQLEWDMKLWWPHNEALIAFLMAYKYTQNREYLEKFYAVFDFTFSHFVDSEHGEWYGYLSRRGEVSMDFKGGPWKGFFHLPRCLLMCEQMIRGLVSA